MCRQQVFTLIGIIGVIFILAKCSSTNNATLGLACTATGTVFSGDSTVSNSSVVLSGVTVSVSGGTGPFTITLPGTSAVTSTSSTYSYSGDLTVITSEPGVISSEVDVTDSATALSTACAISLGGGTSSIVITASPSSSVAVGQSITLSATDTSAVSPTFTFTQSSAIAGVSVNAISTSEATVTSSVAATVTVTVTMTDSTGTFDTNDISLTFGGGSTTGSIQITSSTTTAAPGGSIVVTASDPTNPGASFGFAPSEAGIATLTTYSYNSVSVSSYQATTVTIYVSEFDAGNTTIIATGSVTLSFTGSGITTGSVTCQLTASGSYYVGQVMTFSLTSSDGEAVLFTQFNPGEVWTSPPPLPLYSPISFYYEYPGQKTITVTGQTASGIPCNGGQPIIYSIYIY